MVYLDNTTETVVEKGGKTVRIATETVVVDDLSTSETVAMLRVLLQEL